MSRTRKDRGWHRRYYISEKGHAEFTRLMRRRARMQFKAELRRGEEPSRKSRWQYAWYD